jgi:hypothetical protein
LGKLLTSGSSRLRRSGVNERAIARRQAVVEKKLKKRDTTVVLNTNHHSNATFTENSPETTIFESSGTCVLNPEGETGPVSQNTLCF